MSGLSVLMFRWSARAIKSLAMGELEARKLKYPTTGSEAILMGILVEGLCVSSQTHVCFSLFYLLCLLLFSLWLLGEAYDFSLDES